MNRRGTIKTYEKCPLPQSLSRFVDFYDPLWKTISGNRLVMKQVFFGVSRDALRDIQRRDWQWVETELWDLLQWKIYRKQKILRVQLPHFFHFIYFFFYSLYEGTGKRLLVKFRRKKLSFGQIFFSWTHGKAGKDRTHAVHVHLFPFRLPPLG